MVCGVDVLKNRSEFMVFFGGNVYGCGNIGDDAVAAGVVEAIKANNEQQFTLSYESHEGLPLPFMDGSNTILDCYDFSSFTETLNAVEMLIIGGGTMIGDELTLGFPLEHLARRVAYAKWMGKKVMFAGVGANRLRTEAGRRIARGLLKLADCVSVRDEASLNVCCELYPQNAAHYRCDADPAFLLGATPTARSAKIKASFAGRGRVIGVNVLNEAWGHLRGYKEAIAGACDVLHEKYGFATVFFCNEVRRDDYFDLMANLETASLMKSPYKVLYPDYLTPGEMMDVIGGFDAVLSLRMHALIFAAVMGVPFCGISRVDKMDNFFAQFGMNPCGQIETVTADQILKTMDVLLSEWPAKKVSEKVDDLRKRARGIGTAILQLAEEPTPRQKQFTPELLPYLEGVSLNQIRWERLKKGELTPYKLIQKVLR